MQQQLTNQPTKGPAIHAYPGSPLDLELEFEVGYTIPTVTVEIRRNSVILAQTHQPQVTPDGQLRLVSLSAEQTRKLPPKTELLVLLDGVVKLSCELIISQSATLRNQNNSIAVDVAVALRLQVAINDLDRVIVAQQAAATSLQVQEDVVTRHSNIVERHDDIIARQSEANSDFEAIGLSAIEIETNRQEVAQNAQTVSGQTDTVSTLHGEVDADAQAVEISRAQVADNATAAAGSATAAADSATAAAGSATTATNKAAEASTSATNAANSAAALVAVDSALSPNLILGASLVPDNATVALAPPATTATTWRMNRQSGTIASVSIERNFRGFPFAVKLGGMEPSSRSNFLSNRVLTTELLPVGSSTMAGVFLFVPEGAVISNVSFVMLNATASTSQSGSERSILLNSAEFIDLGSGLRWYRMKTPHVIAAAADNLVSLGIYVYTDAASVAGANIYFAAPAWVRTTVPLAPRIHLGYEKLPDFSTLPLRTEIQPLINATISAEIPAYRYNSFRDWRFMKQVLGSASLAGPWTQFTSGSANSMYLPPISFVSELTPLGNRAMRIAHARRSADNYRSDHQLKQLVVIPDQWVGVTTLTLQFWARRDSTLITLAASFSTFYSDAAGTVTISSANTPAPVITETVVGEYMLVRYENVPVPANTRSMLLGIRSQASTTAVLDTTYYLYLAGAAVSWGTATAKVFPLNLDEKLSDSGAVPSVLIGRRTVFYGDSIVAANQSGTVDGAVVSGREVAIIRDQFGLLPIIRGVGGTSVVDNGSIAWFDANGMYLARPDNGGTQPAGSIELDSAMSTVERISTIPLDTEILFIRGGTNDYVNYPVGNVDSPHDNTTFSGAYMLMLDRIYARIPNAIIILATPLHRNGEDTAVGTGSAAGVTFEQVRSAIRAIARRYKYLLADTSESGINQLNHTVYLTDGTHPNNTGYAKMANVGKSVFRKIFGE